MFEPAKRVLVIGEEPGLRSLISEILEDAGYAVESAADGGTALAAFQARGADLAILDAGVSGGEGWRILETLRAAVPLPPVLLIAGRGENPRQGPFRDCVAAYLFKPLHSGELLGMCKRILTLATRRAHFLSERRKEPRRRLLVEVTLLSPEGRPGFPATLLNFSSLGFQLELATRLEAGCGVRIAFQVPGADSPLLLEGRIRWCYPRGDAFLAGGEIVAVPPEDERILQAVLHPLE